jgi:hypothetical protein
MKNNSINAGEGNSIIIHAHFDLIEGPHPFLENLPYGADIKKRAKNVITAKLSIRMIVYL